ncbi:MAG: hypothetical protein ACKVVP_19045 [Chloroflexota bacterium]
MRGAIHSTGTYTATLTAAGQTDQTVTITLTRQASAELRLPVSPDPGHHHWAMSTYTCDPVGKRMSSVRAGTRRMNANEKVES